MFAKVLVTYQRTSYIPAHIHKRIAIGEMTRVIRNTTSTAVCEHYKRKLLKSFKRRGYNMYVLKQIWNIKHANRITMLLPKKCKPYNERQTPLCIPFT